MILSQKLKTCFSISDNLTSEINRLRESIRDMSGTMIPPADNATITLREPSTENFEMLKRLLQHGFGTVNLISPLKEALRCLICQDFAKQGPVYFSTCCRALINCPTCHPLIGEDCPHCRAAGFQTIAVHAFDEVIAILANLDN